jgi:hypothetical protein
MFARVRFGAWMGITQEGRRRSAAVPQAAHSAAPRGGEGSMICDFFLIDETWLRQRKWSPDTNTWEPGPFDLGRRLPYRGPLRWRRVEPAWSPRDYVSQVLKTLLGIVSALCPCTATGTPACFSWGARRTI